MRKKILTLRILPIIAIGVMIFMGCGQQTLKDDDLDSKSIDEAGTSSEENTGFSVSSTSPSNNASGVSRTPSITITFSDNVYFDQSGSSMTNWTRSYSTTGSCSGSSYNNYSIHLSEDSFSNCLPDNGTVSGRTVTLTINKTLSATKNIKIGLLMVRKTKLSGISQASDSSSVSFPCLTSCPSAYCFLKKVISAQMYFLFPFY